MATSSMVPGIGGAPLGLDLADIPLDDTPAVEIEIENPEGLKIGVDGMEIDLMPDMNSGTADVPFDANLAEHMDQSALQKLASEVLDLVDADISSRKDWVEMYVKGLEVLGMKYEERTEPWNGACGVFSTLLTEAAVRFQSETIIETFPAAGPVKTEIIGAIDKLKEEAAERVRDDMNYQLTEVMTEYRPEHERMLFNLGLAGAAFKKVYYDPSLDRQVAVFVPAEEIIIPYGSSDIRSAPRVSQLMRKTENDIKKLQVAGFYRDVDLGEPLSFHTDVEKKKAEDQGYSLTDDDRYHIYEAHLDWDLEGYEDPDGIALPYVITIDKGTQEVLAIRRNWEPTDKKKLKRQHFVHYQYIPGFGPYGFGLFHLIGGYAKSATSLMRQLVDAGTLSNLPGGLKSRGLRIKGDDTPIAPGEWRDVDTGSGAIRDNILPLPYKEPSATLYQLLGTIVEEGRRFAATADIQVSDMSANTPVGTTLAVLERTLKVMSAVQARVHYALKQELRLLADIIRDFSPDDYDYEPEEGSRRAKKSDYSDVEIIPVSDPNAATLSQRVVQYQAVLQLAQGAPQIYDMPLLHRQMLEVLGIKNANKLVPMDDDKKPEDPITENMNILNLKPVKAFLYQDHEAHIKVHMSAAQDPLIQQMVGQNPQAQMIAQAMQSHIMEHIAFAYRAKMQQALGADLPPPGDGLDPAVEVQLSRLVSQAAPMVLQQSQSQVAQQQAQQQAQQAAQDPVIQMQQQELKLREQELQLKAQEIQIKAAAEADKLELEKERLQAEMELKGMQQGSKIKLDQAKFEADNEKEGV